MTFASLASHFLIGAVLVSLFAAVASAFKPKTFAGLFGAAPPIALASLSMAFAEHGVRHIELLTRSMCLGAIALGVYAASCAALICLRHVPVWLSAVLSWAGWGAVATALFFGVIA